MRDVLRHPLIVAAAVAIILRVIAGVLGWHAARVGSVASFVMRAIAALALAAFAIVAAYYAWSPHYFDVAEPTVPAVGWMYHLGQPIYHAATDPSRYSHVWGPLIFMVHGGILGILGPSIGASKAIGPIAAALALVVLWRTLRRDTDAATAWTGTGLCAAVLLAFRHYSFWTRPEPLQLLCVSVGLAAVAWPQTMAAVGVGVSQGLLWNLKLTGPLYSAPILTLLFVRRGWRPVGVALVVALSVAAAPFALDARVSLREYLFWFGVSARSGIEWRLFVVNLEWLLFALTPLALVYWFSRATPTARSDRLVAAALVSGLLGVALAASKPGAGAYHLMAFAPIVAAIGAGRVARRVPATSITSSTSIAALAIAVAIAAIATAQQAAWLSTMIARDGRDEAGDLRAFMASHTPRVEMAYGADEPATLERPVLVFSSGRYLIDQPAVREHQLNGIEIPPATIAAIRGCDADYWLVPQGDDPWTGRNTYPTVLGRPFYPASLREAFLEAYERSGGTRYFDVWRCRARQLP